METADGVNLFVQIAVSGVTLIAVLLAFRFNIESKRYERMSENWLTLMVLFVDYLNRLEDVANNRLHINQETRAEEWAIVRFKRIIGDLAEKINEAASKLYFFLPDKTYDLVDKLIVELNSCREVVYNATGNRMDENELTGPLEEAKKAFYSLKEYSDKILKIRSRDLIAIRPRSPQQRHRLEI